jgi:dTDP-L-rhamnose 4-epimerase
VPESVLITGGAGFIGRHLSLALLRRGYHVRVLDSLIEQVHGGDRNGAEALPPEVEFQAGDVRDGAAVAKALRGIDRVVHLAAEVGVGQSMYAVERYVSVNDCGTAVLFQQLIEAPVKRVVVASSMSIYGSTAPPTAAPPRRWSAARAGPGSPGTPSTRRVSPCGRSRRRNRSARL